MKIHFTFLLMCFGVALSAQYYTEGVMPTSLRDFKVDQNKSIADSLYAAGNYQGAADTYKILGENWRSILNDPNATESQVQNYFFSETMFLKTRFRLGHREDSYSSLTRLENLILEMLGVDHLFFGMYYHELGLMTFQHTGNAQQSFDETYRALQIREEQLPEYKKDLGWSYNNLAVIIERMYGVDTSLHYQFKALEKRKEIVPADPGMLLVSYSNISQDYLVKGNIKLEREYLLKAQEAGKSLDADHPYNLMVITNLAKVYRRGGEFREALKFAKYALSLRRKNAVEEGVVTLRDNYQTIADNYLALGYQDSSATYLDTIISILHKYDENYAITLAYVALAKTKDNKDESIKILKEAISYCDIDSECNDTWRGNIYHDISENYLLKNDPYQALIFALKAKELYGRVSFENNINEVELYRTFANISTAMGDTTEAIEYLKTSLKFQEDDSQVNKYWVLKTKHELADLYSDTGEFLAAENIYQDLFSSIEQNENIAKGVFRDAYRSLSIHYQNKRDLELAKTAALNAGSFMSKKELDNSDNALVAFQLFKVFKESGEENKAKTEFVRACEFLGIESWLNQNFEKPQIPPFKLTRSIEQIIELYEYSGNYFYSDTESQLNVIKSVISLLDDCRNNYFFYDSEQQLYDLESRFYDLVISQLFEKYKVESSRQLLNVVLLVIEKSRSIGFARVNQRQKLIDANEVHASIISEENRINFQSEKAFQEFTSLNTGSNDSLLFDLTMRLDQLNSDKDSLLQELELNHPQYYKDRYLHNVINLKEAQRICTQQNIGLLNYYSAKSKIYAFIITRSNVYFKSIERESIDVQLQELKNSLTIPYVTSNETDYYKSKSKFIELSSIIFEALIGKEILTDLPEQVVIISDGELVSLPFEVLLVESVSLETKFRSLPYLLRDKIISYNGSITQYQTKQRKPSGLNYEGYAPSYEINMSKDQAQNSDLSVRPLIRNVEEVEKSSLLFGGKIFIGKDANVDVFKQNIGNANILHLAMHTYVDNSIPLDSYMNFGSTEENSNGSLHAHEIVELNINAELVILSACETNAGEQQDKKGEGIKGIARSFFIAMCPNLIISNWLVDDQSSNKIVYKFLQGVKGGDSPGKALRTSKLDFIANSSTVHSHPTYWAPFIYYGSPVQLAPQVKISNNTWYAVSAVLISVLSSLLLWRAFR